GRVKCHAWPAKPKRRKTKCRIIGPNKLRGSGCRSSVVPMASIYDLKPRFQALLRPLTRRLAAIGVTANQVTVAAALLSLAAGTMIALWHEEDWPLLLLPGVLLIRMSLNSIEGMLAREHG